VDKEGRRDKNKPNLENEQSRERASEELALPTRMRRKMASFKEEGSAGSTPGRLNQKKEADKKLALAEQSGSPEREAGRGNQ